MTPRGTIFGGRLDCYVLGNGDPVVTWGRCCPLEERAVIDEIFARCDVVCHGESAAHPLYRCDDFVQELITFCADRERPAAQREIGRGWLQALVQRGFSDAIGRVRGGVQ